MSFGPGTNEKATYEVSAQLDIDDGSGLVENYATLSWLKPTDALDSQDGLVNLFKKLDNPPNARKVVMTITGNEALGRKLKGFSLVVEKEENA
jgi:hypothetical protein